MTTEAVLGSGPNGEGRRLWLTNAQGTLQRVKGITAVNRPSLTVDEQEKTSHDSGGVREFMAGLIDPGQFEATLRHVSGSDTDELLIEHLLSKETRPAVLQEPRPDGTYFNTRCLAFLTGYEPDDGPVDTVTDATLTARVSGLPDFDADVTLPVEDDD